MSKILIQNARVISSSLDYFSDIFIENGKIAAINHHIQNDEVDFAIDATEYLLFPGGIDAHVHLDLPTPAGNSSDNFDTGSNAAIAGGTTSIIDFVTPRRNQSLIEALEQRKIVAQNSHIDYKFHIGISRWNENTEKEMEICVKDFGVKSFKTYLAYKESIGIEYSELYQIIKTAKRLNALVTVHCENGDKVKQLQNQLISEEKTGPEFHPISRPPEIEAEAVKEVLEIAKQLDAPIYLVHISTKESVELIINARKQGVKVFAETCSQYLMLEDSVYKKSNFENAAYVISPPIREKSHSLALWKAIEEGVFDVIATDHCPFNLHGQKDKGLNNFTRIPNGAGGIEHRLSLLYTYGVLQNKITLNQFVDLTSTKPAKIFDVFPQKGEIAVGSDADILIWNPKAEKTISVKTQMQNCDSNIYEGIHTVGSPEYVIVNGEIAFSKGEFSTQVLHGKFLK
ncbi:MAG: dihydropyrimidinase [Bacteroidetes bacterium]|nr:dihydropyrimidinase [Bacteroidota bacterium]